MDAQQYKGIWRSYQSFYHNGIVKKHGLSSYKEIILELTEDLTFRSFGKFTNSRTVARDQWDVRTWDNRRFLFLEGKKAFEIITFDPKDIVLVDAVTAEKIFYSSLPEWSQRLEPAKQSDENVLITIWSPSLIKRISVE